MTTLLQALGDRADFTILVAALGVDVLLGESPSLFHPVVWMGKLTRVAERRFGEGRPWEQLVGGALLALGIPALFALAAGAFQQGNGPVPIIGWFVGVWLTKSTFALRALGKAAMELRALVARGDLEGARLALRSLCSRDPKEMDGPALASGAVSSLAENACDSFVAPLFYFAIGGLPVAMFYRGVNTLDAMIGYRGRYEYLGKAAARLDDLLNFIPARITALLLLAGGGLLGYDVRRGWRTLRRDGRKTPSPNGGRPMAAMAGLLGVTLEKPGTYALGDAITPITVETIDRAWRVVKVAAVLTAAIVLGVLRLTRG